MQNDIIVNAKGSLNYFELNWKMQDIRIVEFSGAKYH